MKLTKKQIKAIELLTDLALDHKPSGKDFDDDDYYRFETLIKHPEDKELFIVKTLIISNDEIEFSQLNRGKKNRKLPIKLSWLSPLHQIINENKTKPLYEFDCDSCNSNWKSDFDGEFHNGDCEYDGDRSEYYNGEVIIKKIIGFEKGKGEK